MPCIGMQEAVKTQAEEKARDKQRAKLAELEQKLQAGQVKPVKDAAGRVTFQGWSAQDRGGWHDECAHRALLAAGSSALRLSLARAGTQQQQRAVGR